MGRGPERAFGGSMREAFPVARVTGFEQGRKPTIGRQGVLLIARSKVIEVFVALRGRRGFRKERGKRVQCKPVDAANAREQPNGVRLGPRGAAFETGTAWFALGVKVLVVHLDSARLC